MNAHANLDAAALRAAGMSFTEIGAALGISRTTARRRADPERAQREREAERERERKRQFREVFPLHRGTTGRDWLFLESAEPHGVKIEHVKQAAADHYGVAPAVLLIPRRDLATIHGRHIAIFLACQETGKSLPQIGRAFGGLDHKTVLHARRKIAALVTAGDPIVTADVNAIRARLNAGRALQ